MQCERVYTSVYASYIINTDNREPADALKFIFILSLEIYNQFIIYVF